MVTGDDTRDAAAPEAGAMVNAKVKLLVLDDHPEERFLLAKTLLRKFPNAIVLECISAEPAFDLIREQPVDAIVCHRTFEHDPVSLVRELRSRNPTVPILMVSGIDRTDAALAAGANAFLITDQWLLVGVKVAALLSAHGQQQGSNAEDNSGHRR